MTSVLVRATTLGLATAVLAVGAADAANMKYSKKLPILVDKYYEIKNPAGPVTAVKKVPEKLIKGPALKTMPGQPSVQFQLR